MIDSGAVAMIPPHANAKESRRPSPRPPAPSLHAFAVMLIDSSTPIRLFSFPPTGTCHDVTIGGMKAGGASGIQNTVRMGTGTYRQCWGHRETTGRGIQEGQKEGKGKASGTRTQAKNGMICPQHVHRNPKPGQAEPRWQHGGENGQEWQEWREYGCKKTQKGMVVGRQVRCLSCPRMFDGGGLACRQVARWRYNANRNNLVREQRQANASLMAYV